MSRTVVREALVWLTASPKRGAGSNVMRRSSLQLGAQDADGAARAMRWDLSEGRSG